VEHLRTRKALRRWFLGAALGFSAFALLFACSTTPLPPASTDASIVTGQLRLDVSGTGTGNFNADGFINARYPQGATRQWWAVVTVRNEAGGKTFETTASTQSGRFMIANVGPGQYFVSKLWCQVQTTNSWVTLTTNFDTPPSFQVLPHNITNLGEIEWNFSYDLSDYSSTSSVLFTQNLAPTKSTITQLVANTPWAGYEISGATVDAEKSGPLSVVSSLMPKTGGHPSFRLQ
jgi:hypothetical protein